ncbi:MAG TPA: TPM domain-containing protein, partial [Sphingomicrobium sp.]|nr:TPM domain-containing protein [Sphingomicrobium sp.]
MIRLLAALWLAIFSLGISAAPSAAQTFPPLTGRVVDQADLLQPAQEAELDAKLATLEQQSGRQLVVATVKSLEGRPIEDYGYRLGRAWGIGQKGKDDGVVLLVAPNERKVRIETGYGARVFLTDAVSSVIIRNAITPRFKAGDFAGGINGGVDAISEMMRLPAAEAQKRAAQIGASEASRSRGQGGVGVVPVAFWIMIMAFVILSMVRRVGGGKRYRRGGGDNLGIILWGLSEAARAASRGGGGGGW